MDIRRSINTSFWSDEWVEMRDPIEKLLYLYLLTNQQTNIAGIYEVSLKRMAFETGLDRDTVSNILNRFQEAGKIKIVDSYIIICNWLDNQAMNTNMKKGAWDVLEALPDAVKSVALTVASYGSFLKDSEGFGMLRKKEKEKEKESEKEIILLKDASNGDAVPMQAIKIDYNFQRQEWEGLQDNKRSEWVRAYPEISVETELKRAAAWLTANPKRRKKDYAKFLINWFSRAVSYARSNNNSYKKPTKKSYGL